MKFIVLPCDGIGPEIVAKAFRDAPDDMAGCVVAGDVATLQRSLQLLVLWQASYARP